jgi:hypothetical protein
LKKKKIEDMKVALTKAPVLASPNFAKDLILFSFASKHTIVGVLLQKDGQNFEIPIEYYSITFRDSPLKYYIMEKQAYALVKALKDFRVYKLHSHTVAYVLNSFVKDILTQTDPEGKRGKWIVFLLEYDLEIKPTKLIKGQGLENLMAQSNFELLGINFIVDLSANSEDEKAPRVSQNFLESPWYLLAQGKTQGSKLQQRINKTLTIGPFGNTCEADEVSPKVEAGGVAGLKCLQPSWDTDL